VYNNSRRKEAALAATPIPKPTALAAITEEVI